jgi:porphobilinogen synthase
MVEQTVLLPQDFIFPLFLIEGQNQAIEVGSMPGIFRLSADKILFEIESCINLGINSFALFPALDESQKDPMASQSTNPDGLYLKTIRSIKTRFPQICLMSDVAMDPYSSDGHDGIYQNGKILNDETLPILAAMAVAQAEAGIDIVGPSDMMDGRVGFIRQELDKKGFTEVLIMAYTAKYASAFYGPFRDALDSAPRHGDKKTYQMNPANQTEALLEAQLDFEEGADFLMVKPALAYLDVIAKLSENFPIPIAAYNVSGEFAMIEAAAQKGWIDGQKVMLETLISIKRAGAKVILSYFAKRFAALVRA